MDLNMMELCREVLRDRYNSETNDINMNRKVYDMKSENGTIHVDFNDYDNYVYPDINVLKGDIIDNGVKTTIYDKFGNKRDIDFSDIFVSDVTVKVYNEDNIKYDKVVINRNNEDDMESLIVENEVVGNDKIIRSSGNELFNEIKVEIVGEGGSDVIGGGSMDGVNSGNNESDGDTIVIGGGTINQTDGGNYENGNVNENEDQYKLYETTVIIDSKLNQYTREIVPTEGTYGISKVNLLISGADNHLKGGEIGTISENGPYLLPELNPQTQKFGYAQGAILNVQVPQSDLNIESVRNYNKLIVRPEWNSHPIEITPNTGYDAMGKVVFEIENKLCPTYGYDISGFIENCDIDSSIVNKISSNGTYKITDSSIFGMGGYSGYKPGGRFVVDVPMPVIGGKSEIIETNGSHYIYPDVGVDALENVEVIVDVPVNELGNIGELEIKENKTIYLERLIPSGKQGISGGIIRVNTNREKHSIRYIVNSVDENVKIDFSDGSWEDVVEDHGKYNCNGKTNIFVYEDEDNICVQCYSQVYGQNYEVDNSGVEVEYHDGMKWYERSGLILSSGIVFYDNNNVNLFNLEGIEFGDFVQGFKYCIKLNKNKYEIMYNN